MQKIETKERRKPGPKPDTQMDLVILGLRMEGLTFREIASRTGLDVKSVYRRYTRARDTVGKT